MLFLGIFISLLGVINIRGNISTIHKYNRRKVKEEEVKKYGKAVGTATLILGLSFVFGYIALFCSEKEMLCIVFSAAVVGSDT